MAWVKGLNSTREGLTHIQRGLLCYLGEGHGFRLTTWEVTEPRQGQGVGKRTYLSLSFPPRSLH